MYRFSDQRLSNVQSVLRSWAQQILCSLGRSQRLSPGSLSALYMWFLMCCPLLQLFLAQFTIRQWRMLLWLLTEVCGFTDISLPTKYELANILKGRNQKGLDSGLRILQTCVWLLNKYQNSKMKGSLGFRTNHCWTMNNMILCFVKLQRWFAIPFLIVCISSSSACIRYKAIEYTEPASFGRRGSQSPWDRAWVVTEIRPPCPYTLPLPYILYPALILHLILYLAPIFYPPQCAAQANPP